MTTGKRGTTAAQDQQGDDMSVGMAKAVAIPVAEAAVKGRAGTAGRVLGTAAGYVGAAGAGLGGAYTISNRGDYNDNQKWYTAAMCALALAGASAVALAYKGGNIARGATGTELKGLVTEFEAAAAATRRGTKASVTADERFARAGADLLRFADAQAPTIDRALKFKNMSGMVIGGAAPALLMTHTRLDPGTLDVNLSVESLLREESSVAKAETEVRDAADLAGRAAGAAGDAGGSLADTIGDAMPWN